jgi:chromosome segregation ATPase
MVSRVKILENVLSKLKEQAADLTHVIKAYESKLTGLQTQHEAEIAALRKENSDLSEELAVKQEVARVEMRPAIPNPEVMELLGLRIELGDEIEACRVLNLLCVVLWATM